MTDRIWNNRKLNFSWLLILLLVGCQCNSDSDGAMQNGLWAEKGKASWYGAKLHGNPTASGAPFDMNALTAAHKTLPFGTKVRVTDLGNQKSVIVEINDRGPYSHGRIIDVSKAAADVIGLTQKGVSEVLIEEVVSVDSD